MKTNSALCPKKADGPAADWKPASFAAAGHIFSFFLLSIKTHSTKVFIPAHAAAAAAAAAEEFKHFHLMLSITLFIPQFQPLKY